MKLYINLLFFASLNIALVHSNAAPVEQKAELNWGVKLSDYGSLEGQGFIEAFPGTLFATTAECKLLIIDSKNGDVTSEYQMPGSSPNCRPSFSNDPKFNAPINTDDDVVIFYSPKNGNIAGVNYDGTERFTTSVQGFIVNMMLSPAFKAVAVAHNTPNATISYLSVTDGGLLGSATVESETIGPISKYALTGNAARETRWFYGVASGDLYEVNAYNVSKPIITNLGNIGNAGYPSGPAVVLSNSPYTVYIPTASNHTATDPNPSIYHYEVPHGSTIEVGKHRSRILLDDYIDGQLVLYHNNVGEHGVGEHGVYYGYNAGMIQCRTKTLDMRWSKKITNTWAHGMPRPLLSSSFQPRTIINNDLYAKKIVQGLSLDDGQELWSTDCRDLNTYLSLEIDCYDTGNGNGGYIALDRYGKGSFFYSIDGTFLIKATVVDITEQPTEVPTKAPTKSPSESPSISPSHFETSTPSISSQVSPSGSNEKEDGEYEGGQIAGWGIGLIVTVIAFAWFCYQQLMGKRAAAAAATASWDNSTP